MKYFVFMLFTVTAFAASSLVDEAERLRDSLPLHDPSRLALDLRLAGLLYDEALAPEAKDATAMRHRAVALYSGALDKTSGVTKLKVQFQLARLKSDLGDGGATALWKTLVEQNDAVDLKREAALRLGEMMEKDPARAADAHRYYTLAISLGQGTDVEAYAHYRAAWVFKGEGKIKEAAAEMRQALYDSRGGVREEALRDLLGLLARSADGDAAISEVEALGEKLARPKLLQELADGLLTAGNKKAGAAALARYDRRAPNLLNAARLLEERYGMRDWEGFREVLGSLGTRTTGDEAEPILRRLLVQLDAERVTDPKHAVDFQDTVDVYLKLYPKSGERMKMIRGWLAAEKDADRKIAKLGALIDGPAYAWTPAETLTLTETRAGIARGAKRFDVVATDMDRSLALENDPKKKRTYQFSLAVALESTREHDRALAQLSELAQGDDEIATKAELLALHILAETKAYARLHESGRQWLAHHAPHAEIKKMTDEAEFEAAVTGGATPEALATFAQACLTKRFLPRSCDNARVLAVQLHDERTLLSILKTQGKVTDLAAENEAAGYFAESAELLGDKPTLKTALLYELAGRETDRNRILRAVVANLGGKSPGAEEGALFAMLRDAKLLSLKIGWSAKTRCAAAEQLEAREALRKCSERTGPAWSRLAVDETRGAAAKQRALGMKHFERRLAAIKAMNDVASKFLEGADSATRVDLAMIAGDAYADLAREIAASPVPAGHEAELAQAAAPFAAKAKELAELAARERAAIPVVAPAPSAPVTSFPDAALAELHKNPGDPTALEALRTFYRDRGIERLSSYFEGRLESARKESNHANAI